MRLLDVLLLARGALGGNKLRSGLTMLGMTIGVFSVVGVMTALSAVRSAIDSGLSTLGANVFAVSRTSNVSFTGDNSEYRNRKQLTIDQARRFKALMQERDPAVRVAVSQERGRVKLRAGKEETHPIFSVKGVTEDYLPMENLTLLRGRPLSREDDTFARNFTVIGDSVRERLFPNIDPLGRDIVIDGRKYQIVGLLERKGEMFGQSRDNFLLIPLSRHQQDFNAWWRDADLMVRAPGTEEVERAVELSTGTMRLVRGLEPEDPNDFGIMTNDSLLDAFAEVAVIVGTGGLVISGVALLTAGIGIMNIMLVSVSERTREIGVLKSIGARNRDILRQFLVEAIFLSELGGLIGIALGVAVGNAVAQQMDAPMIFPFFWAGVAIGICSAIGITFGLYPALKAARLNPVEALRHA